MKRIQTACLHQTIHFQLKDNVPPKLRSALFGKKRKNTRKI